jgi:hypothetical protein
MRKIVPLLSLSLSCLVGTPANASSFDYYTDGVYDCYMQINRDIQGGLSKRYLSEYSGKYLVGMSVDNSPIVDIIFYKTVGSKNNLDPEIAKYVPTGKTYIIFGYFDRLADAKYLLKKIKSYGISAKIFQGKSKKEWKRNPVVINKLINDLKRAVSNTPVRVAVIDRTQVRTKVVHKERRTLPTSQKASKKAPNSRRLNSKEVLDSFLRLRAKTKRENVGNGTFINEGRSYQVGDRVAPGLTLKGSMCGPIDCIAVLRGDDDLTYRIKFPPLPGAEREDAQKSLPPQEKTKGEAKASEAKNREPASSMKPEQNEDLNTTGESGEGASSPLPIGLEKNEERKKRSEKTGELPRVATCDFGKIHTAQTMDGRFVSVADTQYRNLKTKVEVKAHGLRQVQVRKTGADPLIIRTRAFRKHCTQ